MKKFTIVILMFFSLLAFNSSVLAQPGCGNTDLGLLPLTEDWQSQTGAAGQIPYWSFDAVAGNTYGFSSCLCSEDTYLRIYNSSFSQVASNDDYGPHCSSSIRASINWVCTTSGTYYVSIAHYSCVVFSLGWTFEFKVTIPQPPPANDECADAEVVGEVVDFPFNTADATTSGVGLHSIGKDIWYVYTPAANGTIDVGLCGSSFDTKLAVWDACGGTELGYNDNGCYSKAIQSNIDNIEVIGGADYFIQVGGYSTYSGSGLLTIAFEAAPVTGDLSGTVTDFDTGLGIEDALVTITPSTKESVYTDEFGDYSIALEAGDYNVIVTADGYEPSEPLGELISIILGGTVTLDFELIPIPPPANDECADAEVVGEVVNFPFNTTEATTSGVGIHSIGKDIWYVYTPAANGTIDVGLCGSSFDTKLAVWDACGGIELGYNDDGCFVKALQSSIDGIEVESGEDYYIQVGGYGSGAGEGFLTIDFFPPGVLSGTVSEQISGDPLQGVTVVAEPGGFETTSNYLGEYELELLEGDYDLTFSKVDYYPVTISGVSILSGETTTMDAMMETVPAPICADLVFPTDNDINVFPDAVLEWEMPLGSPPALGYRLSLYNITENVWVEENTDLGNVTTYTPAEPFAWGTSYIWLLTPYNNAGEPEGCAPWSFSTSFSGTLDGNVEDSQSGQPVEDVDVAIVEVFPNSGYTVNLTTDADGNWDFVWETGVYNITFSKFGYFSKTVNTVSININQITLLNIQLDPVTPYPMPFFEDWNSGSFATHQWTKEGNWGLSGAGFPGPSAYFNWDPEVFNFDMTLQSYFIDARNESDVFVQFDMFIDDYPYQYDLVTLEFMVYDGEEWIEIASYDNSFGDIGGTLTFDVSEFVAGKQFFLGYRAYGYDTWDIDGIYIDNILVTNSIFEIDPPAISDVLFFNESKNYDINLYNFGISNINWEAVIDPASPWASLSMDLGTLLPGSETLTLTFDAALAGPGTHTAMITFTDTEGIFEKTISIELKVYEQDGQKIMIPGANQWGYISSYINVISKASLEELFSDIVDDMVILLGNDGIYWPGFSINTLGNYNTYEGYKIKMGDVASLAFLGEIVEDKTVYFDAGMHMIPVLSSEPVSSAAIFGDHDIEFAFSLDGSIYWPAGPIMTLTTLEPGYGYFVKFNAPATLDFGSTPPKTIVPNNPPVFKNTTPWNEVFTTSSFHLIGITAEASAELEKGDIIGVFNSEGLCTGMINYAGNGEALAIPVFVDDITTDNLDGMTEMEPMMIKIYRNGEEITTNPVYSREAPNYNGLFASNGFSIINSFKEGATGIVNSSSDAISVYPNPSGGTFNIHGINDSFRLLVTNSQGQVIMNRTINDSYQLDLTSQPNGLYFVKLTSNESVKLIKVIKQ
ncbi:MAG: carboxypeptidase regulatory-like domain-containing protein [Bacteroidales bacterium]|nr:carboxypeptidase regulatory-like domain-containing protein [Bacteroidales bacterium]